MNTGIVLSGAIVVSISVITISVMFYPLFASVLALVCLGVYLFGYAKSKGRWATMRELIKELFLGW